MPNYVKSVKEATVTLKAKNINVKTSKSDIPFRGAIEA